MVRDHLPAGRIGAGHLETLLDGWRRDRPEAPGYLALAGRLRTLVLDGRLPVRTVLPSERALATLTGASRTLTTAAYRHLREEGFAEGRQGSGTWTTLPRHGDDQVWPATATSVGTGDLSTAAPEAPPELHHALLAAVEELPRLLPGHGYTSAGLPELRAAIAERYTRRGLPTRPEEVVVTSGAGQGIRLTLATLTRPGARVISEDPTWPLALDAARATRARPIALPVEDGWHPDAVTALVRRTGATLAYLMPDGQNPTGRLLDGPDRVHLATALADSGCITVVDETHAELDLRAHLDEPGALTPPPFGAGGRPGTVVHIGSASKVFWGGLRVGWVRAERSVIDRLTTARIAEDLGGPPLEQLVTTHLLAGIEPLLHRRRAEMAARCRALQAALARELPDWAAPTPQGGLFLWCRLPGPISTAVAQAARSAGLTLAPGPRFGVSGGWASRLRLTFSAPEPMLDAAVHALARAVRPVLEGAPDMIDAPAPPPV